MTEPIGTRTNWHIYRGDGAPHDGIGDLPPPPPWRSFDGADGTGSGAVVLRQAESARAYQVDGHTVEMVNAALYLRRPLLVTGRPGTGKSTLAFSVAHELALGPVLHWPITSRSTLQDGLYRYDAVGRFQELNLRRDAGSGPGGGGHPPEAPDIGRYIQLGPLGTALVPAPRPRVLLIDELD